MRFPLWRKCLSLVGGVVLVALAGGPAAAQGTDPLIGTWKLNVAKSKYSPGPAPKSTTLKIEAAGQGLKVSVDSIAADGTAVKYSYTANFDGQDVGFVGTNPNADTIAQKRINATTTETTSKKAGKVTVIGTRVISSDGKTMTTTQKGTNAQGQAVNNVLVYEKQASGT